MGLVYAATKSAVDSLTRSLAMELGPRKIRVNTIAPGGVETEGVHQAGIIGSDFEKQLETQRASRFFPYAFLDYRLQRRKHMFVPGRVGQKISVFTGRQFVNR